MINFNLNVSVKLKSNEKKYNCGCNKKRNKILVVINFPDPRNELTPLLAVR